MPLQIRSIAVRIAVTSFFSVSLIGWFSGLSPFTCCKRAIVGSVLAYIAGVWAVKAVNAIFISAMATNQMNQREEKESGDRD
jgi:hypothetical protein